MLRKDLKAGSGRTLAAETELKDSVKRTNRPKTRWEGKLNHWRHRDTEKTIQILRLCVSVCLWLGFSAGPLNRRYAKVKNSYHMCLERIGA